MKWVETLTGNPGGIGVLVNVLHVLHESLTAQEELVADGTGRGVGATDQGGMMLQDVHS